MQILPGVYLVNGSPFGRHQNGYLIHRDGACLLVDSGDLEDAETLGEVERNAARWGLRLDEASHLLITHAHFDHASHAAALQRRGVQIVASPETVDATASPALAAGDERCIGYAVRRVFEPCRADVVLHDGEEMAVGGLSVRCLAAPGHADGLVVYETRLDGEPLWFVGDLLIGEHAHRGVSLPWTGDPNFDRPRYIQSLARLLERPPCAHLLPGHGPAAIGCGHRVLQMLYTEALTRWR